MLADRQARLAAGALACASAGGQLAASAADAWFLAALGPRHLGVAIAGSSLLVAIVLAVVGALGDRRDRRRLLVGLAAGGVVLLPLLELSHQLGASATAVIGLIAVKQLQAAVELGFWIAIAERFDARATRRLVPWLSAAGGVGATLGAALVVPLAGRGGTTAVMLVAAAAMGGAALLAARLDPARRVAARTGRRRGRWSDGVVALRRQPLARGLAVVVALAGAFASLAYFALGATAAGRYADAGELAQFLGGARAIAQAAMLLVQLAIAPRLLGWAGVGGALLIAPAGAAGAGGLLVVAGGLIVAALVQIQARVLDGAIEAPAEKLAQNLLPAELRGRIGGVLDGVAKRAGAVVGGLTAGLLVGAPRGLAIALVVTALGWLAAAIVLRGHLPGWALTALGGSARRRRGPADHDDEVVLGERGARRALALLDRASPVRAAELARDLHRAGAVDARPAIALYLPRATTAEQAAVARALWACVAAPGGREPSAALVAALAALPSVRDPDALEWTVRAVGVLGRGRGSKLDGLITAGAGAAVAAAVARARLVGASAAIDDAIVLGLDDDDPAGGAAALRDLAIEVEAATAAGDPRRHELGRRLLRIARRDRPGTPDDRAAAIAAIGVLAAASAAMADAEAVLLRTEGHELLRRLADRRAEPAPPPVAAAALLALATWSKLVPTEDVHLIAEGLGDRDDDVRDAAEAGLRALGTAAAPELARLAGFGRRLARDRALALLRDLPVTAVVLDMLIAAELAALDRVVLHARALVELGDAWVLRRLDERVAELGHTTLLLVAARERSDEIAHAARLLRAARGRAERARALEALDAGLPRSLAVVLLPALDDVAPAQRAAGAVDRRASPADRPPDLDAAITAELAGDDALTRAALVRALGDRRAHYRRAIADAAQVAAATIDPFALLRRIATDDEEDDDVPAPVELMLLLAQVPLLRELTTAQLAALVERAEVVDLADGDVLYADGERVEALIVVTDGALAAGERRFTAGHALDELAPLAPRPTVERVVAVGPTRLARITRLELDELVDDEPGLAAVLLRALGERLRPS